MKTITKIACGIAGSILIIVACKTTKNTSTTNSKTTPTPAPVVVALTYNGSIKSILADNCNDCHSNPKKKKGDFTQYLGVKAKIDSGMFNDRVFVKKDMPPKFKNPLSSADLDKLKKWLDAGAPE